MKSDFRLRGREIFEQHKWPLFIGIMILIVFLFVNNNQSQTIDLSHQIEEITQANFVDDSTEEISTTIENQQIIVEIKGAISKPGIYEMATDDRLFDLIQKAGGLLTDANTTSINQAQKLQDQMSIYVAFQGEEVTTASQINGMSMNDQVMDNELININTADQTSLVELPGIGPGKAQMILEYREAHGNFKDISELMNVDGIGQKTFDKLKDRITVG